MPLEITRAESPSDYEAFGELIREYETWLEGRYIDVPGLIETIHRHQDIDAELRSLSMKFGAPNGLTLLARHDDEVAGAVAFRDLGDHVCEMKRMYIRPAFHSRGLGRQLCTVLIESASAAGFHSMRLDTGFLNIEAMALYESLGFTSRGPYLPNPPEVEPYLRYYERSLP